MLPQYKSLPFYHKLALVLVSLIALGYLVILAKDLLSPIIFSCLFSILLLPLANFLEHRLRFSRGLASMLSVLFLLAAVSLVIYIVGTQIGSLAEDWPLFKQQLASTLSDLQHWISQKYHITVHKQLNYVQTATDKVLESGTAIVGSTILSISSILLFLIFTFIFTFFFLAYRRLIMHFLVDVFMEENATTVHEIVKNVQHILRKYILGLLIEMAIVSTIVCLAFWALNVKYAILLGLLTGLFNIIPYIGIFTAMLLSVLITFATAATAGKIVLVLVSLVATHLIDSNVLLPVIVGSKVKINPLVTVLGVVIGEMIWGISGMFLSIPVIAVMKIIFDRVESLKPWGLILGEDEKHAGKKNKKLVTLPVESPGDSV